MAKQVWTLNVDDIKLHFELVNRPWARKRSLKLNGHTLYEGRFPNLQDGAKLHTTLGGHEIAFLISNESTLYSLLGTGLKYYMTIDQICVETKRRIEAPKCFLKAQVWWSLLLTLALTGLTWMVIEDKSIGTLLAAFGALPAWVVNILIVGIFLKSANQPINKPGDIPFTIPTTLLEQLYTQAAVEASPATGNVLAETEIRNVSHRGNQIEELIGAALTTLVFGAAAIGVGVFVKNAVSGGGSRSSSTSSPVPSYTPPRRTPPSRPAPRPVSPVHSMPKSAPAVKPAPRKVQKLCHKCNGTGMTETKRCGNCENGVIWAGSIEMSGECPKCNGGYIKEECSYCNGKGYIEVEK